MSALLPAADYVVLGSRIALGLDGGYAIAVPARLRLLEAAGAREPLMLSVDGQSAEAHAEQRQAFVDAGLLDSTDRFRNLFDELRESPSWLFAAGETGTFAAGLTYRAVTDAAGRPVVSLPVFENDPEWHLSDAPVVVHAPSGDRVLPGFRGLYLAWLRSIAAARRAAGASNPFVVICESRQIGEVLVGWDDPDVRLVHTVHNSHLPAPHDDPSAELAAPWARWLERVHDYDAVLWPTAGQRDDIADRFGADERFHVVPSTIELGSPPVDPASRDPRLVVMLGRLAPQKRVDVAIRAFSRVVAAVPDARLEVYGDGPLRDELQQLVDELGLGGSVRLCGATTERDAIFDRAALLLVSTAFEGQGLSIAEALARGLAVVSTDARYGPREAIGDAGVLVPLGDSDALGDAVVALLRDDARRAELSALAREAARAFTPEVVQPVLVAALTAAVASGHTRQPRPVQSLPSQGS